MWTNRVLVARTAPRITVTAVRPGFGARVYPLPPTARTGPSGVVNCFPPLVRAGRVFCPAGTRLLPSGSACCG